MAKPDRKDDRSGRFAYAGSLWAVSLPFGIGQLLLAFVLYRGTHDGKA